MSDNAPSPDVAAILDVVDAVPPGWDVSITYPTHRSVDYEFTSYPQLELVGGVGDAVHTVSVVADIGDPPVFRGYHVTSSAHDGAALRPACSHRRLQTLSQAELEADGVDVTPCDPASDAERRAAAMPLLAAASLAVYHAATLDERPEAVATPAATTSAD